ncbi:MAG: terminase [Candidatus Thiodiazotropha sp. (ex Codakia orbicularis)]|nr:terminase [Candidatus Thiodiazotropha sp. (ex Codakia orbicularis)]
MTAATEELSDEDRLAEIIRGFKHDPLGYVQYAFPWGETESELEDEEIREWQVEYLEDLGEKLRAGKLNDYEVIRKAISSGHGPGKSALVAWLIKWAMDTQVDTKGVVTANTETQLKTKTWPELAKWHRMAITKDWFHYTATALFSTDKLHEKTWRIDMVPWSERNTEAFAGLHNKGKRILLIFDEASAIPDTIWEVSEGALTDEKTEIIWAVFGNPTRNSGRFRECWRKFKKRWWRRKIDTRTVKGSKDKQIQEWLEDYGEDSDFFKVRVRGEFPNQSAKQFFSLEDVDGAKGRHLRPEQYNFAAKIIACDPAWEGDDMLVIGMRQGLHYQILRVIPKNDNDIQIANILITLEDEHQADAVFIDAGYGTGIYSAGATLGRDWQLVWFGSAATKAGFANKRAEMANDTKQWLKKGGAIPDDDDLYEEMIGVEQVAKLDGKVQLESKKEYKARQGESCDRLDNLFITFAYPVTHLHGQGNRGGQQQAVSDFDPYASEAA